MSKNGEYYSYLPDGFAKMKTCYDMFVAHPDFRGMEIVFERVDISFDNRNSKTKSTCSFDSHGNVTKKLLKGVEKKNLS